MKLSSPRKINENYSWPWGVYRLMRVGFSVIVLVLFCAPGLVRAQEPPPRTVVTVDSTFSSYPKLKQQADEIGAAFIRKDFQRFAKLTYPKLINIAGGKENFLKALTEETKREEEQGLEVVSSMPTDVTQFLDVSGSLYAVMPTAQRMKMGGELFEGYGCLIGISNDKGEHWTFLNAPARGVKEILPNVAAKLSLCPEKRPVKVTSQ